MFTFPFKQIDALIQPYLEQGEIDPVIIHHNDTAYVVKFARQEKGRLWREWCSAAACLIFFGVKVKPCLLHTGDIHFEAERLRSLKALGLHVPTVYQETKHYLVMEHCGDSVAHMLKHTPPDTKRLYSIIDSLITLHLAGQWHGGAQMRNLTIKEGVIYRIDFEENTGNAMPLAMAQAYDVLQCFNSIALLLNEDKLLGASLLNYYLQRVNNAEIKRFLHRTNRCFQVLRKLSVFLSENQKKSKDVHRIFYFADILAISLKAAP